MFDKIFENNKKWISEKLAIDANYFENLSKGQHPEYLYIGCSDSRVTAEDLMGVGPGEVFIHRNIANLVVSTDNNINAVVQYAVEYLKVKHIIICGHYECGGVNAALNPSDMGQLNSWLQTLRDVYRFHQAELDAIENKKEKFDRLVELNVQEQCVNLIKTAVVQQYYLQTGYPVVHGWVFDMRSGKLKDLNIDFAHILHDIQEIYNLTGKDWFDGSDR
jgi:carbonic anhydrase